MRIFSVISLLMIAIASGCSSSALEGGDKHYVILMGGQSNMVGQGRPSEIERKIPENIQFFNLKTSDYGPHPNRFGPEVGVWKVLEKEFSDKKFIVIKYATGGSSMLDWSANYDREKAKITGHPEFGNMYETFLQKTDSITRNYNCEFIALLWMQGERDAKILEASKEYHENFSTFIHAIRQRLSASKLPVIYGLSNPDSSKYPFLKTVQAAQRKIDQEIEETYLIDLKASDLDKWKDNVHYSTTGQLNLGKKFGEKFIEISEIMD